jgi:hypothetical protein
VRLIATPQQSPLSPHIRDGFEEGLFGFGPVLAAVAGQVGFAAIFGFIDFTAAQHFGPELFQSGDGLFSL